MGNKINPKPPSNFNLIGNETPPNFNFHKLANTITPSAFALPPLPNELLENVISFLTVEPLGYCYLVNKTWFILTTNLVKRWPMSEEKLRLWKPVIYFEELTQPDIGKKICDYLHNNYFFVLRIHPETINFSQFLMKLVSFSGYSRHANNPKSSGLISRGSSRVYQFFVKDIDGLSVPVTSKNDALELVSYFEEIGSLLLERISEGLNLEPSAHLKNFKSRDQSVLKIYPRSQRKLNYYHPGLLTLVSSATSFELQLKISDKFLKVDQLTGKPYDLIVFPGKAIEATTFSFFLGLQHIFRATKPNACFHYEIRADLSKNLDPKQQAQGSILQFAEKLLGYPKALNDILQPFLEANPLCSVM
eukprot:TRINITY_DN27_c0_g1_i1.p1 TRINITY_DN27_c0_g1~~TRINITY_DN27_c0_g1_i1.p1  ORF type:complete len:361 (-),score=36.05 TRINITY_DN27_c0_g1_i1:53-1135(-)